MTEDCLRNRRVLVVEDEYMLARDLCGELEQAGAVVVGPTPNIEGALALIASERRIDVAALDVNLRGELAFPVAEALSARGVPFVFVTGYEDKTLFAAYSEVPRCEKPLNVVTLAKTLAAELRAPAQTA
jgi:DNA-binding response OmpR family regulator